MEVHPARSILFGLLEMNKNLMDKRNMIKTLDIAMILNLENL